MYNIIISILLVTFINTAAFANSFNNDTTYFNAISVSENSINLYWNVAEDDLQILIIWSNQEIDFQPIDGDTYHIGENINDNTHILTISDSDRYTHSNLDQTKTYFYSLWLYDGYYYYDNIKSSDIIEDHEAPTNVEKNIVNNITAISWLEPAAASNCCTSGGEYTFITYKIYKDGLFVDTTTNNYYNQNYSEDDRNVEYGIIAVYREGKSIMKVTDTNLSGNNNPSISSLKIFPNPAREYINFDYNNTIKTANVYSFNGKLVISQSIHSKYQCKINIQDLNNGMYVLELVSDNNTIKSKFIKE